MRYEGEIWMLNPPEEGKVQFWRNYGFTCYNKTTTNGGLRNLLNYFSKEHRKSIIEFAEFAAPDEYWRKYVKQVKKEFQEKDEI